MNFIRRVAWRDLRAIMYSPTGLFVVVLYLGLSGYVFALNVSLTQEATMRYTFSPLSVLTIFIVPLITMRLLSEELRTGTFEVLIAHPVTDFQIVMGKFLAGVAVFMCLLCPTLIYLLILQALGSPDWGPALAGYAGQVLLAAMLIALGLVISSLTQSQVLAAMGAMVGGVIFWLAGTASYSIRGWLGDALAYLAMLEHFATFRRGILDTRSVVYFVATTVMLLYLSVRAIESRRWKFGAAPGGVPRSWTRPRLSLALCALALLPLGEAFFSALTFGRWGFYSFFLVLVAILLVAVPVSLNRVRLRYEFSRRQTGLALTVAINCLLVIALWLLVTFISSRNYLRFDLTSTKRYALSELTETTLEKLEQPVHFIVAVQRPTDLRQEVIDLLDEYTARTKNITVQHIDVVRSPGEAEQVRERFGLTTNLSNEVLAVIGDEVRRIPVTSMVYQPVQQVDGRRVRSAPRFVGEAELTAAILQLTRESPGRIVFLSGHAELSSNSAGDNGLSFVANELRRNGWTINEQVVAPGASSTFPQDTAAVVIAGPRRRLSDENIAALNEFLDRGGGVLLLIDPGVDAGVEPLIHPWNARIGDNLVIDLESHVAGADPTSLSVKRFRTDHPIGKGMGALSVVLPTARRIAVTHAQPNPYVDTTNFMHTSGKGWAVAYQTGSRIRVSPERDRRGPISLALASERYQPEAGVGQAPKTGRLVVIGDSDWLSNRYIDLAGNLDLFLNSIDWLAGRQDLISVRPKVTDVRRMNLTRSQAKGVFWFSVLAMPGLAMLLGTGAIIRRRRGS
jgi:ABC-2 type transport system permease protein